MPNKVQEKVCFIIAPIGTSKSPERQRSDQVLKHIISPVVKKYDYKVIRADQISKPGLITIDIIRLLMDASLVIADLTGYNPNVFYELAVRHATQKPVIQLIADGQSIPFDLAQTRTIFYKLDELDVVENNKEQLEGHINVIETNPQSFENPFSAAIGLQNSNLIEQRYRSIFTVLQIIEQNVKELNTRIGKDSVSEIVMSLAKDVSIPNIPDTSDYDELNAEVFHLEARLIAVRRQIMELEQTLSKKPSDVYEPIVVAERDILIAQTRKLQAMIDLRTKLIENVKYGYPI